MSILRILSITLMLFHRIYYQALHQFEIIIMSSCRCPTTHTVSPHRHPILNHTSSNRSSVNSIAQLNLIIQVYAEPKQTDSVHSISTSLRANFWPHN